MLSWGSARRKRSHVMQCSEQFSADFRVSHPVWLLANVERFGGLRSTSVSSIPPSIDIGVLTIRGRTLKSLVLCKDLYASNVGVLPVLMILADPHLQYPYTYTSPAAAALSFKRYFLPASRLFACPSTKLDESVVCPVNPSKEFDLRRSIRFVKSEVEIDAKLEYG